MMLGHTVSEAEIEKSDLPTPAGESVGLPLKNRTLVKVR